MYLVLSIKAINLNRRQSNFVDSVTHELKSPIASLKLYLQTLNRRNVTDEQRSDFNRFMLEDVERLDHLINHLLEAGRMDKRTKSGEVEDFDLAELVRNIAQSVTLRFRVEPDTIQLDLHPCLLSGVRRDYDMLFGNLIDNAVKYAGMPPEVKIHLRLADGKIEARISDNGPGIPQDKRRKVFKRFVRLGSELEREKPGTGLGLYIVRNLVRVTGGRIKISDSPNGTGTVFEVTIPHVPPTQKVENVDSSKADQSPQSPDNLALE